MELGIFKNLKAFIDTTKGPQASSLGYTVAFSGDELTRISGTVGTEIGQNDGSLSTGKNIQKIMIIDNFQCSLHISFY